MKHRRVHMIYMAAGNSKRFHGNKLLYPIHGKPLYRYGLDTLMKVKEKYPDTTLTVVVQEQAIYDILQKECVRTIYNPDSKKGASYTIKAGIRALEDVKPEDFVMFVVADQPGISADTVERLIYAECEADGCAAVKYGDRKGNPAMFSATLISELMELQEDEGGKKVMRRHPCVYVEASSETELDDIDYTDDLSSGY